MSAQLRIEPTAASEQPTVSDMVTRIRMLTNQAFELEGLYITEGSFEELLAANESNRETWRPLISTYDPRFNDLNAENSICLLARNDRDEIVATQAIRLFDWTGTNFAVETESMRLFYDDPKGSCLPGEHYRVSAIAARQLCGRIAFSGGSWYHPDYRGRGLLGYLSRSVRCMAATRWSHDYTVGIMAEAIALAGVTKTTGFPSMDWTVDMVNSRVGTVRTALIWMDRDHMHRDLVKTLGRSVAKVNRRIN